MLFGTDIYLNCPATTTPPPPFKPVTMDQVMASAGQDSRRALTELLSNFNSVLQERDHERNERVRMNAENSKLWNLCSNLKRERESLQREVTGSSSSGSSSAQREIRHLAARILELESLLNQHGIPLPPPSSSRLSPSIGLPESEPRRPSPGSRSASDNTGAIRERQRSYQSQTERERGSMMSGSTSTTSFATAYSDASQGNRDKERDRQRKAGAATPPTAYAPNTTSIISSGQPVTASPQMSRAREAFSPTPSASGTMPPLSSSASTSTLASYQNGVSQNAANLPVLQPRDKAGLATIPSTPIINDGEEDQGRFTDQTDPRYTASPTSTAFMSNPAQFSRSVASLRSDRSETASSEHLRIAKQSQLPVSPALSAASSFAASQSSMAPSPRSPNPLNSPASSQLHYSGQDSPRSTSHQPPPLSQSASTVPRIISRKASSLDLARPDKKPSPKLPSRSATPPPDIGSPKQPSSPTQYAIVPPRTPARRNSLDEALGSMSYNQGFDNRSFGTPMQDMPDEARRYIMATNVGMTLPSPSSPFNPPSNRAQASAEARQDLPHHRVSADMFALQSLSTALLTFLCHASLVALVLLEDWMMQAWRQVQRLVRAERAQRCKL